MQNLINACEGITNNTSKTRKNPYRLIYRRASGGVITYFDPVSMEPLCYIPDNYTAWAALHYIAFTVHSLTSEGLKPSEVRKETLRRARAFNTAHLRDRVYIKTLTDGVKTSLSYEKRDSNTRAAEFQTCEHEGQSIMVRFFPDPGR